MLRDRLHRLHVLHDLSLRVSGDWSRRIRFVLVAALTGLAILQTAYVFRSSAHTNGPSYVNTPIGSRLTVKVNRGPGGPSVDLSDIAPGSCTYVVVWSPSCAASIGAAKQWTASARDRRSVPAGWYHAWVSVEDSTRSHEAVPRDFPFPQFFRATDVRLEEALKMNVYPVHLVLDRTGKVVSTGAGAPILDESDFLSECRIAFAQP